MPITISPEWEDRICRSVGCTSPFAHLPGIGRLAYEACARLSNWWERTEDNR